MALAAFHSTASAGERTWLGFRVGTTVSHIRLENDSDSDYRFGWTAGAILHHALPYDLGIRVELAYTEKGGENIAAEGDRMELRYLELPILAAIPLRPSRHAGAQLLLGPALSFKLGDSIENLQLPGPAPVQDFETAFIMGVDADWTVRGVRIGAGVRCSLAYTFVVSGWSNQSYTAHLFFSP